MAWGDPWIPRPTWGGNYIDRMPEHKIREILKFACDKLENPNPQDSLEFYEEVINACIDRLAVLSKRV